MSISGCNHSSKTRTRIIKGPPQVAVTWLQWPPLTSVRLAVCSQACFSRASLAALPADVVQRIVDVLVHVQRLGPRHLQQLEEAEIEVRRME